MQGMQCYSTISYHVSKNRSCKMAISIEYLHSLNKQVHVLRASTAPADGMTKNMQASTPATLINCNWLHSFSTFGTECTRFLSTSFAYRKSKEKWNWKQENLQGKGFKERTVSIVMQLCIKKAGLPQVLFYQC